MDKRQSLERVHDVLTMLGISDLADRAPFQLSGGKKRVAIASVLSMNPEVIIFDGPTAALDWRTQHWLVELMAELNAAGKTIIVATHDLAALDQMADRCIVFSEDHTIASTGTPSEVLHNPDPLLFVNLVHEHARRHSKGQAVIEHSHPHPTAAGHHHT